MAYAALVFLDQQLNTNEYNHLYEKEPLHSNVIFLQKLLEDFPGNIKPIKQLESRITDVAYQVSDIICHQKHQKKTFKSCIEEINSIVGNAKEIRKFMETKTRMLRHESPETIAAPSGKNIEVGLDKDLSQMKERIFGHNSALQIIPVTGMGGIGKTTLAKSVFEDPQTVAHFDVRCWVVVSQEYNAENILNEILGNAKDVKLSTKENVASLIVGVHKKLSGRRFLIVMDDVWSVEVWDTVRNAFPDCNKGSRIIVTTRLLEMAKKVSSSIYVHQMQLMTNDQSWELFQKEAFGQNECCPLIWSTPAKPFRITAKDSRWQLLSLRDFSSSIKHNITGRSLREI